VCRGDGDKVHAKSCRGDISPAIGEHCIFYLVLLSLGLCLAFPFLLLQEASLPAKGLDSAKKAPDRDDENELAAASSPMTGPSLPAGPKALSLPLSDASHSSDEELLSFDFRRTWPKKPRKHSDADITMGTRLKMASDAAASVEKELKADLDAAAATGKKPSEGDTVLACGSKRKDLIGRESKLEEEESAVGQPVGGALLTCVTSGGSVNGLSVNGDEAERGNSEAKPERNGADSRRASRGTVGFDSIGRSVNGSARASDGGKRSSDSDSDSCARGSDSGAESLDGSGGSKITGAVSNEVASETGCGEDAGRPLLKRVKRSVDDLLKLKYTAGGVRKEKQGQGAVTRKRKDGEEAAQGGSQKKENEGKITGAQTGGNGNGRTGGAKNGIRTGNGRPKSFNYEEAAIERLEIGQKKTAVMERAELLKKETVKFKKGTRGGVKVLAEVGKKGSAVGLTETGRHDVREEGGEGDSDDDLFAAISCFKYRRGTESSGVKSRQRDSSGIVQRNQLGGKVQNFEEAGTELEDMKDGWDPEKFAKELEERKGGGKHLLEISKEDEGGLAMGTVAKGKSIEKAAGAVSKSGLQIERVTSEGTRRSKRVSRGKDMLLGWKRALKDVQ
jgi:hypothetical protein